MKRTLLFFLLSALFIQNYSQINSDWITDLDSLKTTLLKQDYLFTPYSKTAFKTDIDQLKKVTALELEDKYWNVFDILKKFKLKNLKIKPLELDAFPFKVKKFDADFYLTSIPFNHENLLGSKLKKINNIDIQILFKKVTSVDNIHLKSFLKHYKFIDSDTLKLELVLKNNKSYTVEFPLNKNYNDESLATIIPKKTPFYLQKQERWFWMYGINFGQQVYFKYNIGLSKEFFKKTKDSLQISDLQLAKSYQLPLQSIYDAPTFDDFTEKLFCKFKKRRYKKLFIDFRNNNIGNLTALDNFIKNLKKIKRINKKNNLYLFVDKNISTTATEMVLSLKKQTNATIIGEKSTQISCSTNHIKQFYLPNSAFKITYPDKLYKLEVIQPDIEVKHTFSHYFNGIDPILQKALEK